MNANNTIMDNQIPKLRKLLVATDFSHSADVAFRRALWLAERTAAEVTLAHVLSDVRGALCDVPAEPRQELFAGDIDKFERELRRKADQRLEQQFDPHRCRPVAFRYETLLGVPFVEIIHAVQKEGYDLVIAGTRGLSGVKRFLVGSTAERLVRNCPCPVWIVKAGDERPIRSILIALDFSEASGKALKLAATLATQAGARLNVLHVFDAPFKAAIRLQEETTDAGMRRHRRAMRRRASQLLTEYLQTHLPSGVDAQRRLAHGEPYRIITSWARQLDADLVVMGSVARTGIPGFLIGNTAEKVLRTCDRSILTVKPDGFVSPIQPAFWSLHPECAGSQEVEGPSVM